MRHDQIKNRKPGEFQRLVGVQPAVFEQMLQAVQEHKSVFGRPCKLSEADQLLLTLMYWREYRTMSHIALAYEVSEPTVHRTILKIEQALLASGRFSLPGKKALRGTELELEVVVVDATEIPVQRPQKDKGATTAARRSATPTRRNSSSRRAGSA